MAGLTLTRLARANALDPLSKRIEPWKNPHVSVSLIKNHNVPKEQIQKLLDRTYPPKYLADQLGRTVVPIGQELFGRNTMGPQLWQALAYFQAKIDLKGKLLDGVLKYMEKDNSAPAISFIQSNRECFPSFVREELNLVFLKPG